MAASQGVETGKEDTMVPAETRCVVGIDVANQAHVICALEAPSGAVRHQPSRSEANAEGYALLHSWLRDWGTPETVLLGLEATGPLWEPLYERLIQAGYTVLLREPAANRLVGQQLRRTHWRPTGWMRRHWRVGCWPAWPGPALGPPRPCKRSAR
jgi:hypothetical protein